VALLRSDAVNASIAALDKKRRASGATLSLISVALVVSVAINVLLAHKVRGMAYASSARMSEYQLKPGIRVPPITASLLGGEEETISFGSADRPTVLYFFAPTCTWCARNMGNLKMLVDQENGKYRFIGLSLSEEGLAEYVSKNELKLPVYFGLSTEARKAYKLTGTPQTIVISPEGKVLQNWMGAYVGEQQSQVEAFFHVSLPGLRPAPPPQPTDGE
jgi:hypothetical protein